ncbi:SMEK domain-containing protein [Microbulbifer sp. YPW1]|uniref:SMEK domain-containing protein n=1 Tax=Microbulbifer sp. YPW1 TaxID=2745199 RepID=UPI001598DD73|nr:SMEK domain-containing protein [Microbulbifer sp. YPW1]QKX18155.1 SMEK domain-containing protein [Microbulbifer sp. YPW1]
MTIKSAKNFEEIVMYLSVLRYIFKSRSKRGLYDLNKQAEPFFKNLFNLIYSWDLMDLNEIQNNYPAIDLGDKKEGVCVQITAERGSPKIRRTIKKYNEKMLYKEYGRLVFFILTDKKAYSSEFDTKNKFEFSKERDIWDIDDVLEVVENADFDTIESVHSFLKKELSSIVRLLADKGSLLSQIEDINGIQPKNSLGFLRHLEFDADELEQGHTEVLNLYNKINALSIRSREYLYVLLTRAHTESVFGGDRFYALPADIESYAGLSRDEAVEECQILEANNLVYFENEDYPPRIEIFRPMDVGIDMFVMLKEYLDEDSFKSLIIKCDFSSLDG